MSRPPKRSKTDTSNTLRNTNFNVSIANTLCVPIVALANLIDQFRAENNSLLSPRESSELIRALILFLRCSHAFLNRHRELIEQDNENARGDTDRSTKRI